MCSPPPSGSMPPAPTITVAKGAIYPALTTNGYYQYRDQDLATAGR